MQKKTKSTVIYALGGLLAGIASAFNGTIIIILGILLFLILNVFTRRKFKGKGKSWVIANGLWPYATTWFAIWVILFNL